MQRQVRKCAGKKRQHAEILHQHGVKPPLHIRRQVGRELLYFIVLKKRVDGHIDLYAPKMRVVDRIEEVVLIGIVRVGARPEFCASDIDGVRPGGDDRFQALYGARGR